MKNNRKLADEFPNIAAEWDYTQNGEYTPLNTSSSSHRCVAWQCKKRHIYWTIVAHRTGRGDGCPYCSGKKAIKGKTDFSTLFPILALQWDYEKNVNNPNEYLPYSHYRAFWVCEKGHSYKCAISDRTSKNIICPYCNGRYPIKGETDLQTVNSDLAQEWNYTRNNNLTPADVTIHSNKNVWWVCAKCSFEWKAIINNRSKGKGCPKCSKRNCNK